MEDSVIFSRRRIKAMEQIALDEIFKSKAHGDGEYPRLIDLQISINGCQGFIPS